MIFRVILCVLGESVGFVSRGGCGRYYHNNYKNDTTDKKTKK